MWRRWVEKRGSLRGRCWLVVSWGSLARVVVSSGVACWMGWGIGVGICLGRPFVRSLAHSFVRWPARSLVRWLGCFSGLVFFFASWVSGRLLGLFVLGFCFWVQWIQASFLVDHLLSDWLRQVSSVLIGWWKTRKGALDPVLVLRFFVFCVLWDSDPRCLFGGPPPP